MGMVSMAHSRCSALLLEAFTASMTGADLARVARFVRRADARGSSVMTIFSAAACRRRPSDNEPSFFLEAGQRSFAEFCDFQLGVNGFPPKSLIRQIFLRRREKTALVRRLSWKPIL
jgi:hypothetical protein